jgi:hypothetical protein
MVSSDPTSLAPNTPASDLYRYGVYGIRLISDTKLDLPECSRSPFSEIELRCGTPEFFAAALENARLERRSDWYSLAYPADGSSYVRWSEVGEFLVSADGAKITWLRAPAASIESFQVYLLGQALSFALVKLGFEPLHATAVVISGQAIAFLGDTGYGKSTLAAHFLASGAALLTDDLLLLETSKAGVFAYPGPARIKLFSQIAENVLVTSSAGTPMNTLTSKLILPVQNRHGEPVRLSAIYVLSPPDETSEQEIRMETLSARDAFVALTANTFNLHLVDPGRLRRQLAEASGWLDHVPVKRLLYPRDLLRLPEVYAAVIAHATGEDTRK